MNLMNTYVVIFERQTHLRLCHLRKSSLIYWISLNWLCRGSQQKVPIYYLMEFDFYVLMSQKELFIGIEVISSFTWEEIRIQNLIVYICWELTPCNQTSSYNKDSACKNIQNKHLFHYQTNCSLLLLHICLKLLLL